MKKNSFTSFSIISLFFLTFSSFIYANEQDRSEMLKNIMPTVVNIKSQKYEAPSLQQEIYGKAEKNSSQRYSPVEIGSGVILDAKNGFIITNSHVIHGANNILVTSSTGQSYIATVQGEDSLSDLAVLKIEAKNLQAIKIGRSSLLKVGDSVTAIGNPFGLSQSVTAGIISGLHRQTSSSISNFIQTDAPINPGNSGGALIDKSGELIGINTAILSQGMGNIGIGFAVPSDMMTHIVQQLIKFGNVKRGLLGVTMQELTPQLSRALNTNTDHGAIINSITPQSAAAKAGLIEKDIIVSIDQQDIYTSDEAKSYIGVLRENSKINLVIERNGKKIAKTAKLAPFSRINKVNNNNKILDGINLIDFDEINSNGKLMNGALVTNVQQGCKAWLAGINKGDVIVKLNDTPIKSIQDFMQAKNNLKDRTALIQLHRASSNFFIVIE